MSLNKEGTVITVKVSREMKAKLDAALLEWNEERSQALSACGLPDTGRPYSMSDVVRGALSGWLEQRQANAAGAAPAEEEPPAGPAAPATEEEQRSGEDRRRKGRTPPNATRRLPQLLKSMVGGKGLPEAAGALSTSEARVTEMVEGAELTAMERRAVEALAKRWGLLTDEFPDVNAGE